MTSKPPSKESGASLVEFALLAPFLLLLLIGVIEFAWLFSQHLDVRQGAREAARLMSLNHPEGRSSAARNSSDTDQLVAAICATLEQATNAEVTLQSTGGGDDLATATVAAPASTITNLLSWAVPPSMMLSSDVETRLQIPATWANTTAQVCP
ncbi:MAG TPA: TadE/TadG family type IV pilus assembly protein [Acidimicrobiia bacterium]|nr:TadE/TadG family type IV pilus assembly protein [Acidimicrobiia bacterium]